MTRCYFILIIVLLFGRASSQNLVGKSFVTNVENVRVYPFDPPGNDGKSFYYVHKNTKFTVNGIDKNNNLIISFWLYKNLKDTSENKRFKKPNVLSDSLPRFSFRNIPQLNEIAAGPNNTENETNEYLPGIDPPSDMAYIGPWAGSAAFVMSLASFNQQTQLYYGKSVKFNWGAITLPVKLRFGNKSERYFNFEEKINLGLSAGVKQQLQCRADQSLNYLVGFGIANVKLDSISLKPGFYDSKRLSETAFSINLGLLYQYEVFQVGLFLGKDFLSSSLSREWRYQGKTWIGLAIGVSLFAKPSANTSVGTN